MLHVCVQKFDVTGNFEFFWKLNRAFVLKQTAHELAAHLGPVTRSTQPESNSKSHPLPRHSPFSPRPPPPMAPMATISAPLAARASPSGLLSHRWGRTLPVPALSSSRLFPRLNLTLIFSLVVCVGAMEPEQALVSEVRFPTLFLA
jgi:hypothetical protein